MLLFKKLHNDTKQCASVVIIFTHQAHLDLEAIAPLLKRAIANSPSAAPTVLVFVSLVQSIRFHDGLGVLGIPGPLFFCGSVHLYVGYLTTESMGGCSRPSSVVANRGQATACCVRLKSAP